MGYTARRRLFVSATAVFAALMLAALALIARDGVSGAINRAMLGVLVVLWSAALTGFPFALIAVLRGSGHSRRRPSRDRALDGFGYQANVAMVKEPRVPSRDHGLP
jgi:hypothetical protein